MFKIFQRQKSEPTNTIRKTKEITKRVLLSLRHHSLQAITSEGRNNLSQMRTSVTQGIQNAQLGEQGSRQFNKIIDTRLAKAKTDSKM